MDFHKNLYIVFLPLSLEKGYFSILLKRESILAINGFL
jgi:hypothetical protein